jgi:hypothetical protein
MIIKKELSEEQFPNKENLIYIAGFIDGEGCLTINKRKISRNQKNDFYSIRIIISNTNLDILEWICSIVGGSIHKTINENELKRKQGYALCLNVKDAINLLKNISPFLKVKNLQANYLLRFVELKKSFSRKRSNGRYGTLKSSDEYMKLQEEIYRKIRKLNQRGVPEL